MSAAASDALAGLRLRRVQKQMALLMPYDTSLHQSGGFSAVMAVVEELGEEAVGVRCAPWHL